MVHVRVNIGVNAFICVQYVCMLHNWQSLCVETDELERFGMVLCMLICCKRIGDVIFFHTLDLR